jgi:hypothetical protein
VWTLLVDAKNGDIFKKGIERLEAPLWGSGVVHSFGELRRGDKTQGEALRAQLLPSGDHTLDRVQVINDPVGINEGADSQRRGSGRVEITPSAYMRAKSRIVI